MLRQLAQLCSQTSKCALAIQGPSMKMYLLMPSRGQDYLLQTLFTKIHTTQHSMCLHSPCWNSAMPSYPPSADCLSFDKPGPDTCCTVTAAAHTWQISSLAHVDAAVPAAATLKYAKKTTRKLTALSEHVKPPRNPACCCTLHPNTTAVPAC
jgi:hypothetical protein